MKRVAVLFLIGRMLAITAPAWGHVEAYDDNGNYLGEYLGIGANYFQVFIPSLSAIIFFDQSGIIGGQPFYRIYDNATCSGTAVYTFANYPSWVFVSSPDMPPDFAKHYYIMGKAKAFEMHGYYYWSHTGPPDSPWTCAYNPNTIKAVEASQITLDQLPFPVPINFPIRFKMHQEQPVPTDSKAAPGMTAIGMVLMSIGLIASGIYVLRRQSRA